MSHKASKQVKRTFLHAGVNLTEYATSAERHPHINGLLRLLSDPSLTVESFYDVRNKHCNHFQPKSSLGQCFDRLNAEVKTVHNFHDPEFHLANYAADLAYFVERLDINPKTEIYTLVLADEHLNRATPERRNLSIAVKGMYDRAFQLTGIQLN